MTSFVRTDLRLFNLIPPDNITTHIRRCAADLLGMFQNWATKEQPGYYFKVRVQDLVDYLGGLYGKATVSKSAKLLHELGLVLQEKHNKDRQVHTYYYRFQSQVLDRLLQNQPSQEQIESSDAQVEPSDVQSEVFTLYTDPQKTDQASLDPPTNECVVEAEEEMSEEEIQAAISASLGVVFEPSPQEQPAADSADTDCQIEQPKKSRDLTPFFNRLRAIDVPLSGQIRELLVKKPEDQLSRNIAALEEEAGKNGLKNPIASAIAAITRNWQPRMDAAAWWETAARTWGRERRDSLIQNVSRLFSPSSGREEFFIIYKTGKMLKLSEAYNMNWDELAAYGGQS
ncbi:hypothetical protein Ava_D0043 [Trichormus variabilis ATCC 29413]|uniref:Uncharacterized protein n=2 Tax=Anabaena variabilis TaxID=264691 RepID=Q3M2S8_TRIV2|nr:MarR family transcriptional regulator [Trichormus variabilis]ABA24708.1 hypothetical protein Ava_D0043 [Trichormus variabilis ATCC 29413]MBC1217750.1 MarR family transcriptional regulator [Trichormus variabilis ARAD]MBC1258959.1 MarR family transcriptional regulator [Trichormus variabilis V5]MBC1302670.1 MarR family transcriptional regulator [Trichormus variabilis N2B]MBC1324525.1 MarR family transcriptional regulator [Trichormus variabilis 9RC]